MEEDFDILVIGSGLGGLVCANILLKEGYKVLVLEKNNKIGGNLQTFSRNKRIFDTGVHYIGSLGEGEVLYKIFDYLGIAEELKLKKMDEKFDFISFDGDSNEYPISQSRENFISNLTAFFPEERQAIEKYMNLMDEYTQYFPLHNLEPQAFSLDGRLEVMEKTAKEVIFSLTRNEKLRAVLSGVNFLYAGEDNTPFYVHALTVNSYIKSAWRCIKGGSQIAKLLARKVNRGGGKVIKNTEVKEIFIQNDKIEYVLTSKGEKYKAKHFISNIDAKSMLGLMTGDLVKKSYQKRIKDNVDTISSFSLYLTLKPDTIPYKNFNYYHFKDEQKVWNSIDYKVENWPENYMISFGPKTGTDEFASEMMVLAYMRYDEVKQWENTFHTTTHKADRGEDYEIFKKDKAELLLQEIEKKYPAIRESILDICTSTPLTYRDYIGTPSGGMYGYVKDVHNPLQSFLLPGTKINNLLLTGQSIGLHGIYGVAIGSILTCCELLDREYLLEKINNKR